MPVRFGDIQSLSSPVTTIRLLQMLLTCVTFSLAAKFGSVSPYHTFAMFSWCFAFGASVLIFLLEFTQLHSLVSFSWKNLPVTLATFSSLMTMAASVTYPIFVVNGDRKCPDDLGGTTCKYMLAASAFSCLASLSYWVEVYISTGRAGEQGRYMATPPGILKVLQVFGACVIFVALSQLHSNVGVEEDSNAAWNYWCCVGLVSASLLLSLGVIVTILGECRGCCPLPFNRLLVGTSSASLLVYLALAILWGHHLSKKRRWDWDVICQNELSTALMICVNLISYTADFVYSIKLMWPRS